ncbi:MAG: hypothetical protein Q4B59_04610 [Lachnospiraceae bacterium]|nr:hypothetical protein [Lachnospiraceae bacterium]
MAAQRAEIQVMTKRGTGQTSRRQGGFDGVWTEGNTARALQPVRRQEQGSRAQAPARRKVEVPGMNLRYMLFLSVVAAIMVLSCVGYLKRQYQCTTTQKSVISLQTRLASLRRENDEEYNRIMSGVNLEEVKEEAMSRLGMVYAFEDQIVSYEAAKEDFVKQYQEIPD